LQPAETIVMVVDDSKIVRVKTSRALAPQGYQLVLAESGEEAVAKMAAQLPHVIITDVEMPGMDGFELTRLVRSNPLSAHLPVIMITGADDRQEAANAAGVTELLGKPSSEDRLIACIEQARLAVQVAARSGRNRQLKARSRQNSSTELFCSVRTRRSSVRNLLWLHHDQVDSRTSCQ
jgi:CheY-like chemotaxis protein